MDNKYYYVWITILFATTTMVGQVDLTLDSFNTLLAKSDTICPPLSILTKISENCKEHISRDSFISFCQKGKRISKKCNNLKGEGFFLIQEADSNRDDNTQHALDLFFRALPIYEELQQDTRLAHIHKNISYCYALLHKADSMEYYKNIAEKYYLRINDTDGLSSLYRQIGLVKVANNDTEGIDFFLKAMMLVDTTSENYFRLLSNLGHAYNAMGKTKLALQYRHKQLEVLKQLDDIEDKSYHLFNTKTNIAYVHLNSGNYEKALQYFHENINEIAGLLPSDYQDIGSCFNGVGDIHNHCGETDKAILAYKQAIQVGKHFEKNETLVYAQLALARIYTYSGTKINSLQAIQLCQTILNLIDTSPYIAQYELETQQYLYQNYELLSKYREAFKHYKRYELLKKSNTSQKVEQALDSLSTIMYMQSKIAEDKNSITTEQRRLEHIRKRISFGTLSMILLVLLGILLYSYRHRKMLKYKNEELRRLNDALKASDAIRSSFMSSMNHQLRTPMNSIIGFTDLLADLVNTEHKKIVTDIQYASTHLMKLLKNMLNLWELQQSKVKLQKECFNLEDTLEGLIKQYKVNYNNREVKLNYKTSGDDLLNHLIGDPVQLEQILSCLLDNALKFTQQGKIELQTHIRHINYEKVRVKFEVIDTGCGIRKERLPLIFDSFSEIAEVKEQQFAGSGLGLTIAQKIAHLFDSQINVESTLNQGSRFFFEIDFICDKKRLITNQSLVQLSNKKVLLVEDNILNQKLAQTLLERKKMSVTIAENGLIALRHFEQEDFDLVLMDLNMPVMSGFECSRRIRMFSPPKNNTPIVVLSAIAETKVKEEFTQIGINAYISKPFKAAELIGVINDVFT